MRSVRESRVSEGEKAEMMLSSVGCVVEERVGRWRNRCLRSVSVNMWSVLMRERKKRTVYSAMNEVSLRGRREDRERRACVAAVS